MASKTDFKSPGAPAMICSISEIAACCSNASSRSRLSSAIVASALVLDGLRRPLTFGALGRFDLVVVRRRFFMASLSAARVPRASMKSRHSGDRDSLVASCLPQALDKVSYSLKPDFWKGLGAIHVGP